MKGQVLRGSKVFATAVLAAALAGAAGLDAAELVHDPVLAAAAGQPVAVEAALVGAVSDPRVRLHWRPRGKEMFRSVEMGGPATALRATIPGRDVDVAGVEYFIEATAVQGGQRQVVANSPKANPRLNPHAVVVRKDQAAPQVTPLSPMDGDTVDTARPVITAAFSDPDSGIDPASVLVKVNGAPVKDQGNVQAFDSLVSYVPGWDLPEGQNEIVVVVRDRAGNPGSAKWTVTVAARGEQVRERAEGAWSWDGRLGARTEYGHVLSQSRGDAPLPYRPYGLNRALLDVSGRGEDATLRLQVDKSDAERTDQQPVDRYTATYRSRQGLLALGDFSPNFSELSLYNLHQLRGVTLDLHSGRLDRGHSRLVGVWGQTRRPVEQGATGFSGGGDTATFGQYLYGVRWQFGGRWLQMGLNSVTVNDDGDSVRDPGTQLPRYNYVSTADLRLNLPGGLRLDAEAGVDLYSDPTPLLGSSLGTAYKAGLDWDIRAWETRLRFDWRDLGGGFGLLPGGYTTVANPGLIPDYRGYEAGLSQGLFDGQFSLDLGINRWRDNLQGAKTATTTSDFLSVFTSVAPHRWPYLTVGWVQNGQANDADGNTPAGRFVVDNLTRSLTLGLGYTRSFGEQRSGSLNLNWTRQGFADQAALRLGQDLNGDHVVLSAFGAVGPSSFNASLGFGGSEQPAVAAAKTALGADLQPKTSRSFNASLRWNQVWERNVWDSYVGYDLSSSTTDTKPFAAALTESSAVSNRSTFSVGGHYSFAEDQRLGLRLALAVLAGETRATGAPAGSDNVSQLFSHLSYDLDF